MELIDPVKHTFQDVHADVLALLRRPRASNKYVFRPKSYPLFSRWIDAFCALVQVPAEDTRVLGAADWNNDQADFLFVLVSWGCTACLGRWLETTRSPDLAQLTESYWRGVVRSLRILNDSTSFQSSVIQANVPLWAVAMHAAHNSDVAKVTLPILCNGFLTIEWARNLLNKMLVFRAKSKELWCPYVFMA